MTFAELQTFLPESAVKNMPGELGRMVKEDGSSNFEYEFIYFEFDEPTKKGSGTITSSTGGVATIPTGESGSKSADYWIDGYIEIISGDNIGKRYLITDSTTTTITANEFPDDQDGEDYEIRLPLVVKRTFYNSANGYTGERAYEEWL